ncbi:MAG: O-antigen polymerase [Planctomycetota bacterium]|jgi:hypothetical protein
MISDYSDAPLLQVHEFGDVYAGRHRTAYLCVIIAGIAISLVLYKLTAGLTWEYTTKVTLVFGLFVCIAHITWRVRSKPRNYLAPDVFYIIFYATFHFAFLALWFFGIVDANSRAGQRVFRAPEQYYLVMFIVNLGLLSFLFGYELAAPKKKIDVSTKIRTLPTTSWTLAGTAIMLLALIIHLAFIFGIGIRTWLTEGYEVYMRMERYSQYYRLWRIQFHIFSLGFGVYITSVALRHGRLFKGKFGIMLFLIYLCLLALEGGRTHMVTLGMILLLVRHFVIKRIKLKSLIIIAICALIAFSSIRIVRDVAAFNVPKMIEILKHARETEQTHWYDSLVEMGSSVNTVNLTTMLVPGREPYWHGWSYVQAVVHIIPYLSGKLGTYLGFGPSGWLTYTHFGPESAGTGFSISAEGYLNFGLPGVFFHMAIMGIVLRRIYARFATMTTPANTLIFIVAYGLFMITVRNHVNLLITPIFRIIVVAWLLKSLCGEEEVVPTAYEEPDLYESEDGGTDFYI